MPAAATLAEALENQAIPGRRYATAWRRDMEWPVKIPVDWKKLPALRNVTAGNSCVYVMARYLIRHTG